ncbi:MAG: hypothetical protein DSY76_01135 [Bacteroidetes bacterium]|nr:MAG: hypothetical protein DSY76_01135 [Bacteroidota bacterium]
MRIKKNSFIAIALIIIIVSIAYYVALTVTVDSANKELLKVMENNYQDKSLIYDAVKSLDMAIFMMPWNHDLRLNRRSLLLQINDYAGALEAVQDDLKVGKDGLAYEYEGLCYEFLNQKDKAYKSYRKALQLYEDELAETPNDDFRTAEIATLSMILGDTLRAQEILKTRKIPSDSLAASYIERNNQFILQYKSGGLRYFYNKAKERN